MQYSERRLRRRGHAARHWPEPRDRRAAARRLQRAGQQLCGRELVRLIELLGARPDRDPRRASTPRLQLEMALVKAARPQVDHSPDAPRGAPAAARGRGCGRAPADTPTPQAPPRAPPGARPRAAVARGAEPRPARAGRPGRDRRPRTGAAAAHRRRSHGVSRRPTAGAGARRRRARPTRDAAEPDGAAAPSRARRRRAPATATDEGAGAPSRRRATSPTRLAQLKRAWQLVLQQARGR